MKLRNIVWVGMLFLSLLTYAQKPVYSFSDKGDIVTNSSYIKPFDTCTFKGVTPYIMKFENMLKTLSGQTYEIRCYKYNNWENDPGDFHVIEVRYNNNVVLTLENPEGWDFFSQDFVSSIMSYLCYGKVDLDENIEKQPEGNRGIYGLFVKRRNSEKSVANYCLFRYNLKLG